MTAVHDPPIRLLRAITRLNIGGPSLQVISVTGLLASRGYETLVVRGVEGDGEGDMDYLAAQHGLAPTRLTTLRREASLDDLRALGGFVRLIRRLRPHVIETHMAKAGTLARVAALLATRPSKRPVLVHVYHGHSLQGYFSGAMDRMHLAIERTLARRTDRLVAVSSEVCDELVELGVAPRGSFTVLPLGLNLSPFLRGDDERCRRGDAVRTTLDLPHDVPVVSIIARLVPIKRVDRFLRIAERVSERTDARFIIVGDGELREQLHASAQAKRLNPVVNWVGFRRDVPDICFASDVVALTSDNEGTPVTLIEAQAASLPVVSTNVGGTRSVVLDGVSGHVLDVDDEEGFADRIVELLEDKGTARAMGAAGRKHVTVSFDLTVLIDGLDALYTELLRGRRGRR